MLVLSILRAIYVCACTCMHYEILKIVMKRAWNTTVSGHTNEANYKNRSSCETRWACSHSPNNYTCNYLAQYSKGPVYIIVISGAGRNLLYRMHAKTVPNIKLFFTLNTQCVHAVKYDFSYSQPIHV